MWSLSEARWPTPGAINCVETLYLLWKLWWLLCYILNPTEVNPSETWDLYRDLKLHLLGCQSSFSTTHVAFRGKPQWTASVVFLTRVNFRLSPLPGVRLEPILGCSDLTEREAKRDLAAAAQTVYLHRWCQWFVGERERTTRESWSKSVTRICEWVWIWTEPLQTTVLSSLYCIPAYDTSWVSWARFML